MKHKMVIHLLECNRLSSYFNIVSMAFFSFSI